MEPLQTSVAQGSFRIIKIPLFILFVKYFATKINNFATRDGICFDTGSLYCLI